MKPFALRLPAVLTVTVASVASSRCAAPPPPGADAAPAFDGSPLVDALDIAPPTDIPPPLDAASADAPPGCHVVMADRDCFTTCMYLGTGGLQPRACEVYCPRGSSAPCVTADGQPAPDGCELSGDGDGGFYVFC